VVAGRERWTLAKWVRGRKLTGKPEYRCTHYGITFPMRYVWESGRLPGIAYRLVGIVAEQQTVPQ